MAALGHNILALGQQFGDGPEHRHGHRNPAEDPRRAAGAGLPRAGQVQRCADLLGFGEIAPRER